MKILTLATLLLISTAAHAQGTGTCSGASVAGTVGLAVPDAAGNDSVAQAGVPFVFGAAECDCGTDDLLLDIFLTSAFPAGTVGTAELWTGLGCDSDTTARTTAGATICEKVATVDFSKFVTGSTSSSGHVYLSIPALSLFSPVTHMCPSVNESNGLYLLFFTGANASPAGAPAATCSLPGLNEEMLGAGGATNISTTAVDRGFQLGWEAPPTTAVQPTMYQILCADADGKPAMPAVTAPYYSTCIGGKISRRTIQIGGSVTGGTGAGYSDAGTGNGGTLAELDPRFICTAPTLPVDSGAMTSLVTGLDDGKEYQFIVVAIDQYGNATPSLAIPAKLPSKGGGCSLSGSASGGGWASLALASLLALALVRRRRKTTATAACR